MADKLHTALIVGLLLVTISCYAVGSIYVELTLCPWWKPWGVACGLGLLSGVTLWHLWPRVTTSARFLPNYIVNAIFAIGLALLLIAGGNSWLAPAGSEHTEVVTIQRKYRTKHHHSRRVGRRYAANGTPYYRYHAEFTLPGGASHTLTVTESHYRALAIGHEATLTVNAGLLWPTADATSLSPNRPK